MVWDVIVVGAGPAGSIAALEIARLGKRVLLVDRAEFPRHKLCGACLNRNAIAGLQNAGLGEPFARLGGIPLSEFQLRSAGRQLSLRLPAGVAVSRLRLDAMLMESAVAAGCEFLPGVDVVLESADSECAVRRVRSSSRRDSVSLQARCIVVATGLATDRRTSDPALSIVTRQSSRIGAGTTTRSFPDHYGPGTIFMAVGQTGYVGLTRTEESGLNIAAALDHRAVRASGPAEACRSILKDAGFPVSSGMLSGNWRGTTGLTRHRRVPAAARVFVVGDAAGYVEPFTGEGMAWAIRGAQAVVPFVDRALAGWSPQMITQWAKTLQRVIGRRQRSCRILSQILRSPGVVRSLVRVLSAVPSLGQAVVRQLYREHQDELLDPGIRNSRPS